MSRLPSLFKPDRPCPSLFQESKGDSLRPLLPDRFVIPRASGLHVENDAGLWDEGIRRGRRVSILNWQKIHCPSLGLDNDMPAAG